MAATLPARIAFTLSATTPMLVVISGGAWISGQCQLSIAMASACAAISIIIYLFIRTASQTWKKHAVTLKTLEPSDADATTQFAGLILTMATLNADSISKITYEKIIMSYVIFLIFTWSSGAHKHNVVLNIMRYKIYKCQDVNGMSYMIMTKGLILNPSEITSIVQVTDIMWMNVTKHKNTPRTT